MSTPSPFSGLRPRVRRWLGYEQTVNERVVDEARFRPIDRGNDGVRSALRPETRGIWDQEVSWVPTDQVRVYGPLRRQLREAFGIAWPGDRMPMLLHPQAPAPLRRLARAHGCAPLGNVAVTPTASYRSLVAWRRDGARPEAVLKLSLAARIGGKRRSLTELYIAQGVMMTAVLATIPVADRERLGLDWFPEPCGVVDAHSRHGWLLRRLPARMERRGTTTLMPVFSLASCDGDRPPLLVRLIRDSKRSAEDFVIDTLIRPYVDLEAYLLFEQGVQHEGHAQNVLVEIDARERLTGRWVLRDFNDASVNIAFRVARGKPLPRLRPGELPADAPFRIAGNTGDHHTNFRRPFIQRGYDTVERYGLSGFVWPINRSVARFLDRYDAALVERRYLELWQEAAVRSLRVRPLFRAEPRGLATDESIAYFLRHTPWRALGGDPSWLPEDAEPLLGEGRMRRRKGQVYERVTCAWGELFVMDGRPAFFQSAF